MKKEIDWVQVLLVTMVLFFLIMVGLLAIDICNDIQTLGEILSE